MTHACDIFCVLRHRAVRTGSAAEVEPVAQWKGVCTCGKQFSDPQRDTAWTALCEHLGYSQRPF